MKNLATNKNLESAIERNHSKGYPMMFAVKDSKNKILVTNNSGYIGNHKAFLLNDNGTKIAVIGE